MRFVFDGGIIIYKGAGKRRKFLFLENPAGWLDMPKGHIEKGESALEAARRETREEAGIDATPYPFFKDNIEYWSMEKGERIRKHVTFFISEVKKARVKVSREHSSYEWLSLDAAVKRVSYKDQRELLARVRLYLERLDAMRSLNKSYSALPSKSKGWKLSRRFVPGEGPLNAKVMFIGQAPGRQEDAQGRPFIGTSGKLLDRMIRLAGLERSRVYITSVVQFFPPDNRMPTDTEVGACKEFLLRQIAIVKPRLVVAMGSLAAKTLAGIDKVTDMHGKLVRKNWRTYYIVMHPAAAVRLKKFVPVMEADFRKLKKLL